ncbi:MAG TPA: alpha/beta fold hydrolase [Actinospica sp.]|nr:alpha/beta fold hydrolase [Actinospica sp.]
MDDEDLWLLRFHPCAEPAARLVCLPHAGGSASYYFPLSRTLSPEVEVLAVQYPGRQNRLREGYAASIDELVDGVHGALEPIARSSDVPLAFFGHSMGAVVAFELARRLPPLHLFVSGRRAPACLRDERQHTLDDAGLLRVLAENGGTHRSVLDNPELRALFLPTIRNDYRLTESYRYTPGPPLGCPITVLTGDADPAVTLDEATAWRGHTSADFDCRVYSGGHFYLEEHAQRIADLLRVRLVKPSSPQA